MVSLIAFKQNHLWAIFCSKRFLWYLSLECKTNSDKILKQVQTPFTSWLWTYTWLSLEHLEESSDFFEDIRVLTYNSNPREIVFEVYTNNVYPIPRWFKAPPLSLNPLVPLQYYITETGRSITLQKLFALKINMKTITKPKRKSSCVNARGTTPVA